MRKSALSWLFWGLIFVLFSFKYDGVDILPDILGYILMAVGFNYLASENSYFSRASKYNLGLIILSIPRIYDSPDPSTSFKLTLIFILGIILMIAAFALNLFVIYNMFYGIKELAQIQGKHDLSLVAVRKWKNYKMVQIGIILTFIVSIIPMLNLIYIIFILIISIVVAVQILIFINKCRNEIVISN